MLKYLLDVLVKEVLRVVLIRMLVLMFRLLFVILKFFLIILEVSNESGFMVMMVGLLGNLCVIFCD